jgi:hypothetical protein
MGTDLYVVQQTSKNGLENVVYWLVLCLYYYTFWV